MQYIKCKQIYFEDGCKDGYLVVDGKKIVGFLGKDAQVEDYVDYSDYRIIPGIFDTHNHSSHGYAPNKTEENVRGYLKGIASTGVTCILPTQEYNEGRPDYDIIYKLSQEEVDGATIMGIHSEDTERLGHRVGENGIPIATDHIDMDLVKATWENSHGLLKLCGIAPELPGSEEAIKYLTERGVRVAFMHSEAEYAEARESFKKGITVSTHTCNVMRGIHHRHMGGLGACLLDPDLNCEIICDCLHNSPEMLELIFRVKGDFSKWMMISDSTDMTGAPAGVYIPYPGYTGDEKYYITEEGFCLDENGRLSGSAKPVIFGIKNLVERLNMPIETVIKMASLNPARVYGFEETKGSIKIGKDCDLAVIDEDYNVIATYANGRKVFDKDVDKDLVNMAMVNACRVGDLEK